MAQCVEFYYTYKKQVKIGRNGTLIFGDVDATTERAVKDEAEVDIKVTDTKQELLVLKIMLDLIEGRQRHGT